MKTDPDDLVILPDIHLAFTQKNAIAFSPEKTERPIHGRLCSKTTPIERAPT